MSIAATVTNGIVILGHGALRLASRELRTDELELVRVFADRMSSFMDDAPRITGMTAVGLAAPQMAMNIRLAIVHPPDGNRTVLVNPEIVEASDELEDGPEGCFSIPGWTHHVRRPTEVTVRALDLDGNELLFDATGFEARIVCHELDHLDGRLIIDHGPRQQRRAFGRWLMDQHFDAQGIA